MVLSPEGAGEIFSPLSSSFFFRVNAFYLFLLKMTENHAGRMRLFATQFQRHYLEEGRGAQAMEKEDVSEPQVAPSWGKLLF